MTEAKSDAPNAAPDVDIVALKPGAIIGRHEVLAVLGQGGFGITYRARDSQLNREVAIKEYLPASLAYRANGLTVLPRSTKVTEDFQWGRDRFVAEGQTLASLHHAPGIVRVFDFLETNGTAYIVMEMLLGDTLEERIRRDGPLAPARVDRILWILLDGLEQVHAAGFLHRDIKPANILLDARDTPTLIDFGASRAAMAGRTMGMTAIFTPGYAAAEQMTSAKQGPWTDIYGLSATLYHAITGTTPPNAFDRMLDDDYQPLARIAPAGFAPGLITGIDAGLAVRASDRPQSIADWRPLLSKASVGATDVTRLVSSREIDPAATVVVRPPAVEPSLRPALPDPRGEAPSAPAAPRTRTPLYAGIAAAFLLLAGGGWFVLSPSRPPPPTTGQVSAVQDMKIEDLERVLAKRRAADAAEADKKRLEEEAQRKAEAEPASTPAADADLVKAEAQRKQAEAEAAQRKQAEAEAAQRKAEAEMTERAAAAAKQIADADAKAKADADAKAKADAEIAAVAEKKAAEGAEAALHLALPDRQRVQVALASLGFDTRGTDGAFGPRTREMIAAWQKARSRPATGFLDATQHQTLLREARAALQKYDDEQKKKEEEAKRKAEEDVKAKAAAALPAPALPAGAVPVSPSATSAAPPTAPAASASYDGRWSGTAMFPGGGMASLSVMVQNGSGASTWRNSRCGEVNYTLAIRPNGAYRIVINGYDQQCSRRTNTFDGMVQGNTISFMFGTNSFTLTR